MKIVKIESEEDPRLAHFYKTKETSLKKMDIFVCESELVINRALDKDYEPLFFLIKDEEEYLYQDIFKRCKEDILVYEVKEEIFNKLKGYILIKGILACFKRKASVSFESVIKNAKRIVVLEEVTNPTNIGAIFRNAAALYVDAILVTNKTCDPLYKRSIRVSMGNVFNIKWTYVDEDDYLLKLREFGFKTVSFALRCNSVSIDDEKLNSESKLAIILGSEGYGLNKQTINQSDYVCKIPMNNEVDSLNVASASAIALWQLCKNNIESGL